MTHTIEEESLAFTIDLRRSMDEDDAAPSIRLLARLLLNDEQIGCVSSIKIEAHSDKVLPEIVVRFVEKLSPDDVGRLDPAVIETIRSNALRLRKLPFVRVETPIPLDG